jgi:DNA-binding transcriptional ArsR family regulator
MAQLLTPKSTASNGRTSEIPETIQIVAGRLLPEERAAAAGAWFGTLADPTRVRILHALSLAPPLCVGDLATALSLSISALSHQLRFLRDRGVVARRQDGRTVYYSLADDHVRHVLADALVHLAEARDGGQGRDGDDS